MKSQDGKGLLTSTLPAPALSPNHPGLLEVLKALKLLTSAQGPREAQEGMEWMAGSLPRTQEVGKLTLSSALL